MNAVNYVKGIFYGFCLGWIAFILIVSLQIGAPTHTSQFVYDLDTIHSKIAGSISGKKLVIISGSNGHFGISCHTIQEETQVPCLNAAKGNAGLGVEYILDRVRLLLNPGDTVLMALEYELYNDKNRPGEGLVDYVFARDPQYVITHPQVFASISFPRVFNGFAVRFKFSSSFSIGYQAKDVNENGDRINNRQADMTEGQRRKVARLKRIKMSFSPDSYGLKVIKKFAEWCREKNVQILASWPNTIWFDVYKEASYQEVLNNLKEFYKKIGVPVLGNPRDFMYDKSMFYDTIYHLNDRGMRQRTIQLIELLRPYLE